jgi:hypothetical protein
MVDNTEKVVLDRTGLYPVESGFIVIKTEVEWLQHFGVSDSRYWVIGDRLCDWAIKWLDAWDKADLVQIKQSPRHALQTLFAPFNLPTEWTEQQLIALDLKLSQISSSNPHENPMAYFLANVTNSDLPIWQKPPSPENLAQWLNIEVPTEYHFLEQVWQHRQAEQNSTLHPYYQTSDKQQLLKQWLGIVPPTIDNLGNYPFPIPDAIAPEFDNHWISKIIQTDGDAINSLLSTQVGLDRISAIAYKLMRDRPEFILEIRLAKLNLSPQQRQELRSKLPPDKPAPLAIDAGYRAAFDWATNSYLPFRKWETVTQQIPIEQRQSDELASSFEAWIFKHYATLRVAPVAESQLNYNVAAIVQNLYQQSSILWVVIDGLGWLDHQELLQYLTETKELAIETAISPRFSILPTKTEYAKWSLYAQLTCDDSEWKVSADLSKVFQKIGTGKRYTDGKRETQLYPALKQGSDRLYCWDTEKLDELYHSGRDWQSLYEVERPNTLRSLAGQIKYCVKLHPNPESLKIVIASDHGQMMGEVAQIRDYPPNLEAKGRMAIGNTDDPRFLVLDQERFGLPHHISIVKGAYCLGSFNTNLAGESLGTHGGLYPEEVVVGVSVLSTVVTRSPIFVTCEGTGKASQSGEIIISIDNSHNSVPLTSLCLYINEISTLQNGYSDLPSVPAYQKISYPITITYPEVPPDAKNNSLKLTGELIFYFADAERSQAILEPISAIAIQQIFSSGFKNNILEDW